MKIIYIVETRRAGKGKWETDHIAYQTLKDAKDDVEDSKYADTFLKYDYEYRIRRGKLDDVKHAIKT